MKITKILLVLGVLIVIGAATLLMWPKPQIKDTVRVPEDTPSMVPLPLILNDNPIGGDGSIPIINIYTKTAKAGTVIINETILQNNLQITDAECETDIIDKKGQKVVDFQSFYNGGDGIMTYTWGNATPGTYIISQYCWRGIILDLNKIYLNSTLIIN